MGGPWRKSAILSCRSVEPAVAGPVNAAGDKNRRRRKRRLRIAKRQDRTDQWITITGSLVCVSTFCVSLPSSTAVIPRRPCEAITIASHLFLFAAAMIASHGAAAIANVVVQSTFAALALEATSLRILSASCSASFAYSFFDTGS